MVQTSSCKWSSEKVELCFVAFVPRPQFPEYHGDFLRRVSSVDTGMVTRWGTQARCKVSGSALRLTRGKVWRKAFWERCGAYCLAFQWWVSGCKEKQALEWEGNTWAWIPILPVYNLCHFCHLTWSLWAFIFHRKQTEITIIISDSHEY